MFPMVGGGIMNGFKFVFFLGVELPSIIAMSIHKLIYVIKDEPCTPLTIGAYRLIGMSALVVAFFIAAIIFDLSK
jgi:hypothetical protein